MSRSFRPIDTRYAGCKFRSRLEARWAVFFDRTGIEWEYEPEGFQTSAGPYLPDFRIRVAQVKDYSAYQYFEVKPVGAYVDSRHVAFAAESKSPLIVACGMPRSYLDQMRVPTSSLSVIGVDWQAGCPEILSCAFVNVPDLDKSGLMWCALGDQRHWCQEDFGASLPSKTHLSVQCGHAVGAPAASAVVEAAYTAARSARFEFGDAIHDARPNS